MNELRRLFEACHDDMEQEVLSELAKRAGLLWTCTDPECGQDNNADAKECILCKSPNPKIVEKERKEEEEALAKAAKYDNRVLLHHSDEAGWPPRWALGLEEDPAWWVNSFETRKEAEAYAKRHGLKITDRYCTAQGCQYHKYGGKWK